MRKDMAKLITKGHSRPRYTYKKNRFYDLEDYPDRDNMKGHFYGRDGGARDYLTPLYNFLERNVGRHWSKVYSEICAVTDHRNFNGKHLRDHIDNEVVSEIEMSIRPYTHHYYYDTKGILRRVSEKREGLWRSRRLDPDQCVIDDRPYTRINHCWFESEYFTIPTEKLEHRYVPGERKMQLLPKRYIRAIKQLNKKELKRLGLSNEPGWNWYD